MDGLFMWNDQEKQAAPAARKKFLPEVLQMGEREE
jgi:hypothetical protein